MQKNFYGLADEVHAEVSIKEATLMQKICYIITFMEALATAGCFVAGSVLEKQSLYFVGGILACLLPTFIIVAGRTLLSTSKKKKFVVRLCSFLLPGVGYYILLLLIIYQFVYDKERYILMATEISLAIALLGIGIGMYLGYLYGNKKTQQYTKRVEAICVNVEESKMMMNLIDDITRTGYDSDVNKASIFKPTFRYQYNGVEYTNELSYGYGNLNHPFEEGQKVEIFINPNNPNEFSFIQGGEGMLFLMGIAFMILGLIPVICFILTLNWIL